MKLQLEEVNRPPTPVRVSGNNLDSWRAEIDQYYAEMREFSNGMQADEIFLRLSAFSARASEIRTNLVRHETRAFNTFRTKEIDPFIQECDRQFKLWSRIVSVHQIDADLVGRL